jgi:sterol desaturase/sphingolipid hydroxylase (fatty acid hydroxylase superfamily)
MIPKLILTVAAACAFAEFVGYWLHVLLHNEKIPYLSRNHMIHHLVIYAPNKPMRPSRAYLAANYDRASILGIGLEWLLPVAVIVPLSLIALRFAGLGPVLQAAFIAASLGWGLLMFSYMHDAMHQKWFWMERSALWRRWFLRARRLHDVHHMDLDASGRMTRNYGICLFYFDRLFGSLTEEHRTFNREGLKAAFRRYAFIFPNGAPSVE